MVDEVGIEAIIFVTRNQSN